MENVISSVHSVLIQERKSVEIEGVKKIDSFDQKEFFVDTVMGYMHITGQNLALGFMNMEKGTLTIKGTIDGIKYMNKEKDANKESLLKKLFK